MQNNRKYNIKIIRMKKHMRTISLRERANIAHQKWREKNAESRFVVNLYFARSQCKFFRIFTGFFLHSAK